MDELIGGRYRILREISTGGMGVVCEAVHQTTGRRVALKIVRDAVLAEGRSEWMARFEREARAAGSIDTPHIAQVFDAAMDHASGAPFIAMELLTGADLRATLNRLGPLPTPVALKVVAQACRGLEHAHAAGVVHRDIKPGNLFLAEDGDAITVKLVDFGIAKVVSGIALGADGAALTQTGHVLGTPTHMSPEQAKGLRTVDHRSDLWSLGVVLYQTLSGSLPHHTDRGVGELIIAICTEPPPPIRERAPWVSPEVAAIVERALRIDRQERFQRAEEMRLALERLLPEGTALTRSELRPLTPDERLAGEPPGSGSLGESGTQPGVEGPARPASGRFSYVAVAGVLASIGAVYAWSSATGVEAQRAQAVPLGATVEIAPDTRRVDLRIDPPGALVEVDGVPRAVARGRIALEGPLGSSRLVRVQSGSAEQSVRVAITADGAVPASIALSAGTAAPPAETVQPKPAPKPPPPPKSGFGLVNEFE